MKTPDKYWYVGDGISGAWIYEDEIDSCDYYSVVVAVLGEDHIHTGMYQFEEFDEAYKSALELLKLVSEWVIANAQDS